MNNLVVLITRKSMSVTYFNDAKVQDSELAFFFSGKEWLLDRPKNAGMSSMDFFSNILSSLNLMLLLKHK